MNSKGKVIGVFLAAAVLATATAGAAAAAGSEEAEYSFHQGKTVHYGTGGEQTFVYALDGEDSGAAADYRFRNGKNHRGGTGQRHFDTEDFVEAGIISQETADAISEYAAQKHEEISALYENMDNLTQEERHTAYEQRKSLRGEDGLAELVTAGILTEEQAEAITNYTPAL